MKTHRRYGAAWALASTLTAALIASTGTAYAGQEEIQVKRQRSAEAPLRAPVRQGAESRSVTVNFADLDMHRAAGASTLYTRLRTAARSVCTPTPARDIASHRDWNRCYSQALDEAVSATGSDQLSTLHLARTGRSVTGDLALRN